MYKDIERYKGKYQIDENGNVKSLNYRGNTKTEKILKPMLRNNGYLIKSGTSRNMPSQRYLEQGLFEIKESNIQNPDGSVRITKTTKVTGKGQIYFVNKFLEQLTGGERVWATKKKE